MPPTSGGWIKACAIFISYHKVHESMRRCSFQKETYLLEVSMSNKVQQVQFFEARWRDHCSNKCLLPKIRRTILQLWTRVIFSWNPKTTQLVPWNSLKDTQEKTKTKQKHFILLLEVLEEISFNQNLKIFSRNVFHSNLVLSWEMLIHIQMSSLWVLRLSLKR